MKLTVLIPLAAALMAASPAQPVVEVANGDWSQLPALDFRGYDHLTSAAMSHIYRLGYEHKCRLPGMSGHHIDFNVSFAAQFAPDGQLSRLVLPKMNCPEAEAWLGGTLVQAIKRGDYRRTENNPEGWYQGTFNFYYEGRRRTRTLPCPGFSYQRAEDAAYRLHFAGRPAGLGEDRADRVPRRLGPRRRVEVAFLDQRFV